MQDLSHLYPFCNSDAQLEILKAIEEHGNPNAAAKVIGRDPANCRRRFRDIKSRAALAGVYNDSLKKEPVPEGFQVKGTSTLYDADGNAKLQWVKTSQDQERQLEALRGAVEALKEDIEPLPPTNPPASCESHLANLYVISDFHLGAMAWHEETGANWDMKIAENLIIKWFQKAISLSPNSSTAYFLDLGDTEHYDSILAVTPTSGHVLDTDTRFRQLVRVMIRIIRTIIRMLLEKHERVVIIKTEGNHNQSTAIQASEWLSVLYENEPRAEVDTTARPYHCHKFGKNMICATHGHLKKFNEVPLLLAAMFPEVWGKTKFRYCETGHLHHHHEKEHSGMIVTQHQTLAAPDAYAARGGWISDRSAIVKTFHKDHGLCGYLRITPDMV